MSAEADHITRAGQLEHNAAQYLTRRRRLLAIGAALLAISHRLGALGEALLINDEDGQPVMSTLGPREQP